MPYSHHELISIIISEVKSTQPKSVLDVGCGLGIYGLLCRVYLDLYDDSNFFEKLKENGSAKWNITIDGIEGFKGYLEFVPKWSYDNLMIGNALEILPGLEDGKYDLVLALAILEHLTKEEGIFFLKELKRVGRKAIVYVPKEVNEQEVPGNPYETHKSSWTDIDFKDLGFNRFLPHSSAWIAVYDKDMPIANKTKTKELSDIKQGTDLEEVKALLNSLNDKLDIILRDQQTTLNRLSISLRLQSLLTRLKCFFKN